MIPALGLVAAALLWLTWEVRRAPVEPPLERVLVRDRSGTVTAVIDTTAEHRTQYVAWALSIEGRGVGALEPFRARRKV